MIDKMMTVGWQGAHLTCHQTTTWDEAEVPGALRRRTLTRLLHTVFSISISRTTSRWCKGPSHDCHIQSSVFFISHVLFLGGVQDPHTTVTQCEQYYYISRTLVFGGEHLIVDPHTTVKIWTVHWISSAAYCTLKTISHPTALSTHTYSYAYRVHSIKMFYWCIFFYIATLWRRGSQKLLED